MRSALLWAGSVALVAGCADAPQRMPEPVVRAVDVIVEVPTKCIEKMPVKPDVKSPQEIAAMPPGPGVAELGAGFVVLWDYTERLEAVARPCVSSSGGDVAAAN